MAMPEDDIFTPYATRSRPPFGGAQARQRRVVVDIEQAYGRVRVQGLFVRPYSITGACITDRNRPS